MKGLSCAKPLMRGARHPDTASCTAWEGVGSASSRVPMMDMTCRAGAMAQVLCFWVAAVVVFLPCPAEPLVMGHDLNRLNSCFANASSEGCQRPADCSSKDDIMLLAGG